ncbi:MAG: helix-turn-helix domain-containing protein [Pseudomonadales bacterium]|nr:helix-turn-helix domain-containing protein [Pseudomonadales bacterium]
MQLYKYLILKNISQSEFADKIGVSQPTLSRYYNGDTLPSVVIGARIEKATGGEVACSDWENLLSDIKKAVDARIINDMSVELLPISDDEEVIERIDDGANG